MLFDQETADHLAQQIWDNPDHPMVLPRYAADDELTVLLGKGRVMSLRRYLYGTLVGWVGFSCAIHPGEHDGNVNPFLYRVRRWKDRTHSAPPSPTRWQPPPPRQPKEFCPEGHPYDDENTIVYLDGKRRCRTCRAAWNAWQSERRRYRKAVARGELLVPPTRSR